MCGTAYFIHKHSHLLGDRASALTDAAEMAAKWNFFSCTYRQEETLTILPPALPWDTNPNFIADRRINIQIPTIHHHHHHPFFFFQGSCTEHTNITSTTISAACTTDDGIQICTIFCHNLLKIRVDIHHQQRPRVLLGGLMFTGNVVCRVIKKNNNNEIKPKWDALFRESQWCLQTTFKKKNKVICNWGNTNSVIKKKKKSLVNPIDVS